MTDQDKDAEIRRLEVSYDIANGTAERLRKTHDRLVASNDKRYNPEKGLADIEAKEKMASEFLAKINELQSIGE